MKYQTINDALAAIIAGESVDAVAADIQGRLDYAVRYYSCEAHEVAAYRALRAAYTPKPEVAAPKLAPVTIKCSCGCTVPSGLVMSASFGSACADCYDRMSG